MKTNKTSKLITAAITTLAGLGIVGSVGGTYAWYTYNTKATASIYGTSVACTNNLQVRLNNESGDTWRHDITSSEVNAASNALGHSTGELKALSSFNGRKMIGNPISHSTAESAITVQDYYEFRMNFRESVVGSKDNELKAGKDVYITRVSVVANDGTTDITGAVRVAFFKDFNVSDPTIFAPDKDSDGSTNLYGALDLDNESGSDVQFSSKVGVATGDREFEWEKNPDAWDITKAYATDALVKYTDGLVYKAKHTIAENTAWNASDWQCMTHEIIYGVTKDYQPGEDYAEGDTIYYSSAEDGSAGVGYVVNEDFTATTWGSDASKCTELKQEYVGKESVITELEDNPAGGRQVVGSEGLVVATTNDDVRDFSETKTYAVGDYVYYGAYVYRCNTAITTPGAWDITSWNQVTSFTDSADYAVGEFTYQNGILYQAKNAVTAGSAFNPADWKVDSSQVTIRVWLEGWDASIVDTANGAGFKLGFQFETLD